MAWTTDQQAAIDARKGNLLLSAAAGSGKTAVLVERIISRLTDSVSPIAISELLVMTFTRAAASEMRTRIGQALAALEEKTGDPRIAVQLALLGSAQISTIHSFCTSLIRKYFYRLDIEPTVRQASTTERALLFGEAMDETLAVFYDADDEDFLRVTDAFRRKESDQPLRETIANLYEHSRSLPFPDEWLAQLTTPYEAEGEAFEQELSALQSVWEQAWRISLDELERALLLVGQMEGEVGVKLSQHLHDLVRAIESLQQATTWQARYEALQQIAVAKWPSIRTTDGRVKALKDDAKKLRDNVIERLKSWKTNEMATSPKDWEKDCQLAARDVRVLARVTTRFAEVFAAKKRAARVLDFSDLEHLTLSLLLDPVSTSKNIVPSDTAVELRSHYAEVMVDEYQDTNGVQELIATLVSTEENRFMVGDMKQSIYGFRMADPFIFLEKYETYTTDGTQYRRIDLAKNFRSAKAIIGGVNDVFGQIMQPPLSTLSYGKKEALYSGREENQMPKEWVGGSVTARWLIKEELTDDESALTAQATAIANEMIALKTSGRLIQKKDGSFAPVSWRDMVVLCRSIAHRADVFVDVFRNAGIPVFVEQTSGYFAAVEVGMMLSLLAIIDNRRREEELYAVLRSPMVGWTEKELAQLVLRRRELPEATAFAVVEQFVSESALPPSCLTQTRRFLTHYAKWHEAATRMAVADVLRHIFDDTAIRAYLGGLPQGEVRRANMEALYRRAVEFDATVGGGLSAFLRFFERLQEAGEDFGIPTVLGEGEDVVRLMTIHKSKGLEFPVVFLAAMEATPNATDTRRRALLHREHGIGLYAYDVETDVLYPTIRHTVLRHILWRELLAEEQRILYVALTRARDKLYLYGAVNRAADALEKWRHVGAVQEATTFMDWIMAAIISRQDEGEECPLRPDLEGTWDVDFLSPSAVVPVADTSVDVEISPTLMLDQEIVERLSWQYPYQQATELPAKVSVTTVVHRDGMWQTTREKVPDAIPALVHEKESEEDTTTVVQFLDDSEGDTRFFALPTLEEKITLKTTETKINPLRRGTVMHRAVELLNRHVLEVGSDELVDIRSFIAQCPQWTDEERHAISEKALKAWLESDVFLRMKEAKQVLHECPFAVHLTARELGIAPIDEPILLQGVMDALFEEPDGWVIIDYKTDRVWEMTTLKARYEKQLTLYAMALQRALGVNVKEVAIVSLALGQSLAWCPQKNSE